MEKNNSPQKPLHDAPAPGMCCLAIGNNNSHSKKDVSLTSLCHAGPATTEKPVTYKETESSLRVPFSHVPHLRCLSGGGPRNICWRPGSLTPQRRTRVCSLGKNNNSRLKKNVSLNWFYHAGPATQEKLAARQEIKFLLRVPLTRVLILEFFSPVEKSKDNLIETPF